MPVGLRTKKAQEIADRIMGIPVTITGSRRTRKTERVVRSENMDLSKIHADDTGVGRRFV